MGFRGMAGHALAPCGRVIRLGWSGNGRIPLLLDAVSAPGCSASSVVGRHASLAIRRHAKRELRLPFAAVKAQAQPFARRLLGHLSTVARQNLTPSSKAE